MKQPSIIAKSGLAVIAGAMALTSFAAVPSFASAQGYGYDGRTYYDPCRRESTNRATIGAVIGGLAGAAIGSNVAARNARTEGALLGGAVGAVGGGVVGNRSAACVEGGYAPPPRTTYYERRYNEAPYQGDRNYGYGYGARYEDDYATEQRGASYRVTERPAAVDGCTLAESPIYLPDGRVQKRFVRVCPDGAGRYQVVD